MTTTREPSRVDSVHAPSPAHLAASPEHHGEPANCTTGPRGPSRTTVNFLLDSVMLLTLVVVVWLAVLLKVAFPPPSAAAGHTLWGYDYDRWHLAGFAALMVLTTLVLVHLVLHWSWVCGYVRHRIARFTGRKLVHDSSINTVYGVALLIGLLMIGGVLLTLASIAVRAP